MTWQGVSEAECYDNRSVMAQIVRIKDRLTAVEQNVDPTLRTDLEAAIAELTALENTVGNVETQVEANTGNITSLQTDVGEINTELAGKADSATVDAALALKADAADVDADLELKADKTQLTDGSVTKVGTATVGSINTSSAGKPIYLVNGVPAEFKYTVLDTHNDTLINGLLAPKVGFRTIDSPVSVTLDASSEYRWFLVASWQTGVNALVTAMASVRRSTAGDTGGSVVLIEAVMSHIVGTMARWSGVTGSDMNIDMVKARRNPSNTSFEFYARVHKSLNVGNAKRFTACAFTDTKLTVQSVGASVSYEDVVQDGEHYPNITNYLQYAWTNLSSSWTMLNDAS